MKSCFYSYSIRGVNTFSHLSLNQSSDDSKALSSFPSNFFSLSEKSSQRKISSLLPRPDDFHAPANNQPFARTEKLSISGVHPFRGNRAALLFPNLALLSTRFRPRSSSFLPFNWSQRTAHESLLNIALPLRTFVPDGNDCLLVSWTLFLFLQMSTKKGVLFAPAFIDLFILLEFRNVYRSIWIIRLFGWRRELLSIIILITR